MRNIKISPTVSLEIKDAPEEHSSWITVKNTEYRPDRGGFILGRWNKEFPDFIQEDVNKIYSLASRSAKINQWLAAANASYANSESVPEYLRDVVDVDVFKSSSVKMTKITQKSSEHANNLNRLASTYKDNVARENASYDKFVAEEVGKDKVLKVLLLNSSDLPISIQLAIENWTASDDSPSQKDYAREMLINYKIALIEYLNKNKDANIDEIIDAGRLK